MKRWIVLAAALYPRSWREEYSDEFAALLSDVKPGWRIFANVLGGAIRMQITTGTSWLKLAGATAIAGAIVAAGVSFTVPPKYVSTSVITVTPQPDPVRPASPQALQQRAAAQIVEMQSDILSRVSLSRIITKPSLDLYKEERRRAPMEDVIGQMRNDIRVQASPTPGGGRIVLHISFAYRDQAKAQATVRELAGNFADGTIRMNRQDARVYRDFWHDESLRNHTGPAPPPPTGESIDILDPAKRPTESAGPNRIAFMASGVGVGLVLGLLATLAMRRQRGLWQLCGFAAAGSILGSAISLIVPARYTSTAVMQLYPAVLTENPLATPPAVTPAPEFLKQIEPQVLSFESLSGIIEDPRLNLYPEERSKKSMEETIRNMRVRDLRIEVLNPAAAKGLASAFSISFSYDNPHKAQQVVQTLLTMFMDEYINGMRARAPRMSRTLRSIHQRRAGGQLYVLDPPSLPESRTAPNRSMIAALGLGIGLLFGAIVLGIQRPRAAALVTTP